jgi:hypothetical protein
MLGKIDVFYSYSVDYNLGVLLPHQEPPPIDRVVFANMDPAIAISHALAVCICWCIRCRIHMLLHVWVHQVSN